MSGVTPFSSYHATTPTPCDRKSAGGGHREGYRGAELEREEEEAWTERKREESMRSDLHSRKTLKDKQDRRRRKDTEGQNLSNGQ